MGRDTVPCVSLPTALVAPWLGVPWGQVDPGGSSFPSSRPGLLVC